MDPPINIKKRKNVKKKNKKKAIIVDFLKFRNCD